MISLGSRFAEYGLTGGFFVFATLSLLTWFFPDATLAQLGTLSDVLRSQAALFPEAVHPALSSVLVAFAVVGIFLTGLLLDLIGAAGAAWEAYVFTRHLDRNHDWLREFIDRAPHTIRVDYARIREHFISFRESTRRTYAFLRFWHLDSWRISASEILRVTRVTRTFRALASFRRVESHLLAYVIVTSGQAASEWLGDQVRLSRTSRAISTSLFLVAIGVSWPAILSESSQAFIAPIAQNAALILSLFVTSRAYSRFCATLFSLAFASSHPDVKPTA